MADGVMAQDRSKSRGGYLLLLEAVGRAVISSDVEPVLVRDFLARKLPVKPAYDRKSVGKEHRKFSRHRSSDE